MGGEGGGVELLAAQVGGQVEAEVEVAALAGAHLGC